MRVTFDFLHFAHEDTADGGIGQPLWDEVGVVVKLSEELGEVGVL